jgi:hypothetical protein
MMTWWTDQVHLPSNRVHFQHPLCCALPIDALCRIRCLGGKLQTMSGMALSPTPQGHPHLTSQ